MENTEPIFHQNPPTQPLVPDLSPEPISPPPSVDTPVVPVAPASASVTPKQPASIPSSASNLRRKPLLSPQDDPPVATAAAATTNRPPPPATSYIVKTARPVNQRRSKSVLKLVGLIFLGNIFLIGAFAAWYYNFINDQFEKRLSRFPTRQAQDQSQAVNSNTQGTQAPSSNTETSQQISSALQEKITDLQSQIQALQKRVVETEKTAKSLAGNVGRNLATPAIPVATPVTATPAANTTTQAPVTDDLVLLKERNRLTAFADEAISTASREPYERLWHSLEDPRLVNLVHATRAEILRVQNFYLSGSRLDRYDIPVAEYYPESEALRDTQLSDDQLIRLLDNQKNPWQVRLKAANILGMRRSTLVGDALVKAVEKDPNLDVVKEATFSFEQLTGYRAQLFETDALVAWWKQYNETPPSADATKDTSPSPAEEPAAKTADKKADDSSAKSDPQKQTTKDKGKEKPKPTPEAKKSEANPKSSSSEEPPLPQLILPAEKP